MHFWKLLKKIKDILNPKINIIIVMREYCVVVGIFKNGLEITREKIEILLWKELSIKELILHGLMFLNQDKILMQILLRSALIVINRFNFPNLMNINNIMKQKF